jgi:hypothetical protein
MNAKILLPVISALLLLAPCAFAQWAGQAPDTQVENFRSALERDGFDVTEGDVVIWNLAEEWCAYTQGVNSALYFNIEPTEGEEA